MTPPPPVARLFAIYGHYTITETAQQTFSILDENAIEVERIEKSDGPAVLKRVYELEAAR